MDEANRKKVNGLTDVKPMKHVIGELGLRTPCQAEGDTSPKNANKEIAPREFVDSSDDSSHTVATAWKVINCHPGRIALSRARACAGPEPKRQKCLQRASADQLQAAPSQGSEGSASLVFRSHLCADGRARMTQCCVEVAL